MKADVGERAPVQRGTFRLEELLRVRDHDGEVDEKGHEERQT